LEIKIEEIINKIHSQKIVYKGFINIPKMDGKRPSHLSELSTRRKTFGHRPLRALFEDESISIPIRY